MKTSVQYIVFAAALSISPMSIYAQEDSRTGRRVQLEAAKNAERQREEQRRDVFQAAEDAPELMIGQMPASDDAHHLRLQSLLRVTREFVLQIEELYYASVAPDRSKMGLDRRSIELEQTTGELSVLVNFGTNPTEINGAPLPEESLAQRIQRLVNVNRRLVPNLLFLRATIPSI